MAYKNIYAVNITTSFGFGVQPTKGNTAEQAKARFKKRNPKKRVLSVTRIDTDHKHFSHFKSSAI